MSSNSIKLGPWGGNGGSSWSYNPSGSVITGVFVRFSAGRLISIYFKSTNVSSGTSTYSDKFGGYDSNTADYTEVLVDWPEEYFTSISGTAVTSNGLETVQSLTFHTTKGTRSPNGNTNGTPFSIPMEGAQIVGFFGRAGEYVDAIGINVVPKSNV
uniref:Mannose/glucose-specific lectin n=1 Tax=Litchi chinensis TaxID=151069 RepID=E7EDU7_LITCN|nr:mannose/glucose-specific lectin [Litchi chinensis]